METWTSAHQELADQLVALVVNRLLDPLQILLETGDDLRGETVTHAETWARQLLDADDDVAVHTAARLVAVLYTSDTPFDPPALWWRTPLGRVVARRVGHPAVEAVSYSVAGAMLGITRQGVHDLVRRNKLDRHPDGGVTTASIRARLNNPAPPRSTAPKTPIDLKGDR